MDDFVETRDRSNTPPAGRFPLLVTKLRQPRARESLVSRPRLTQRLRAGLGRALILISAPAGFGKTTLLDEWLSGDARGVLTAWLSLDEDDNDQIRFLTYVITALHGAWAGAGAAALAMLSAPHPPPIRVIQTSLLNDLADLPEDLILVLDDYHTIAEPAVHDAVTFLLANLPRQVHLVMATRTEPPLPLSRIRARDQLVEIRGAELLFTLEEAETFLNRAMDLSLGAGDVRSIQWSTEGWIAGLQLIAVSLHGRRDVASLVERVSGAHHYIVDYLVEEVLNRQSEEIRLFLLQTSILRELAGPLCNAVTGRHGSAEVLVRLDRANLLVTPLDEERHWYRYHHLFAECLRGRLAVEMPDIVPDLHRRASGWYESQHLVDEAVSHALSAQDFELAARLVEEHGPSLLRQGRIVVLLSWANRLPWSLVQTEPRLGVLVGHALALGGQLADAEAILRSAEEALAARSLPDSESLHGQIAAVRASIATQRADAPRTIEFARQAISRLPSTEPFVRSLTAFNLGDAHLLTGNVVSACAAFADAVDSGLATGSLHMVAVSSAYLARTQMLCGRLREAERVCQRALDIVARASESPSRTVPTLGMLYAYLGQLKRELDDLDGAGHYLGQALELGEQSGYVEALAASYWALAQLRRAQWDVPAGLAMIERAIDTVHERSLTVTRRLLLAERADLLLALGRLEEAESWARDVRIGESPDLGLSEERECLSLIRLRLARGEVDEALRLSARLLGPAERAGRFGIVIELLALRAVALYGSGQSTQALSALERALVLAEPEGYVRVFADHGDAMDRLLRQVAARGISRDYVARLQMAISSPGQAHRPVTSLAEGVAEPATDGLRGVASEAAVGQGGVEPLTTRELEVLRLLATGVSNQAIADDLKVSVGTAKAHISHILGKLGAHSRTEAIVRARRLKLLDQE